MIFFFFPFSFSSLAGAHTLGAARCRNFKQRLSNFDAVNDVDPTLDSSFAKSLYRACADGDDAEVPFDRTRNVFDRSYFGALQRGMGVLASDQTLFSDPQTRRVVNGYAMNDAMFFFDFQQAVTKMGLLDVKEGNQGEVRADCRRVN